MAETPTGGAAFLRRHLFLLINCVILTVGNCGGPLITRLYFLHGGKRVFFSSWLETAGWPVILIPLFVCYTRRAEKRLFLVRRRVFFGAAGIGLLTGADDYLYAYGMERLPVSTSSLVIATQLAFTAAFAFIIVRQKFTASSINAVALLTVGAVVLGIHSDGDRPTGESSSAYMIGFVTTLAAAAMYGLILPLVELTYARAGQTLSYALVLEVQLILCFFATAFCTVGMLVNNDFQGIAREANEYELGQTIYYLVIVGNSLFWQCFFLGVIGVIFYASSLLSAILITTLLPVTEVLAVIFYGEKFQAEKGIALFLSLWGFASYFYGEIKNDKKNKKEEDKNLLDGQSTTAPV